MLNVRWALPLGISWLWLFAKAGHRREGTGQSSSKQSGVHACAA